MGIGFVDEAIVPDVQTDEYESDNSNEKDNSVQYELPSQRKAYYNVCRFIRAVVMLINA